MSDSHTTHFDDCGCKTAEYERRLAELQTELAAYREMVLAAEQIDFEAYGIGRIVKNGKWKISDLNSGEDVPGEFDKALEAFNAIQRERAEEPARSDHETTA
jgi:hypothetical protein